MAKIFMAAYTNYRRDPRVKREAEALAPEHDVVFLARRQPGEPSREIIAQVRVRKAFGLKGKPNSFMGYMVDYLLFFMALTWHLTLHPKRYQLIHISNMPDFLVFAAWLPRLMGVPVIHDIHDLMPELYMEKFSAAENHWAIKLLLLQERLAATMATAVLTVEDRLRDILSNRGIPRDKIHVLINLPDEAIFVPQKMRRRKSGDAFVLVYHGTLARRLGLDLAIEAVAGLKHKLKNLEFRIIGAGEERDRLIQLRNRLGLEDIVRFSDGFVPVEAIPETLKDADLGIVPLRPSPGTDIMLPTKLLEYVQMGIPCVVPKTTTIARYFDDDMVRFFAADSADSLAKAISELHNHPQKRRQLAQNAAARFLSRYRWREHKFVYINLVNHLLSGLPVACQAAVEQAAGAAQQPMKSRTKAVVKKPES